MSRQMQEIVIGNVKGPKGDTGLTGPQGEPFKYEDFTPEQLESLKGPAPVRGVDYWTESDKTEIVNDVLASIPNYNEESF